MHIKKAKRLSQLPPYLFAEIDRLKKEVQDSGKKIISLGIGDPDLPTPEFIVTRSKTGVSNPANHQYPSYRGMPSFRNAISRWYKKRFNVTLNPEKEIVSLIGSKEGIAHIPLAFVEKGDIVLCPDPAYPVYKISTIFAGGTPYIIPLLEKNKFLPDLTRIPKRILRKTKLMFLNYPNNPTSAVATEEFFKTAIEYAQKYNFAICHDAAYTELYYNDNVQPSFLEIPGAKDVGIEFHSLSKTYNMTGWRIGWAAGNPEIIEGLGSIKENIDSGIFQAVQVAGTEALLSNQDSVKEMRKIYQERRDALLDGLDELGWKYFEPQATFYVWAHSPNGLPSKEAAMKILNSTGVVVTPGVGFGKYGEGYIRFALTVDVPIIKEVIEKLKGVKF